MAISSRFSVAVHILSLLEISKTERLTSEFIASSVNTNSVVVRRIMGMLNKAGIINTSPGVARAMISRPIAQISLLDVYLAVEIDHQDHLFSIHDKANPNCLVGKNIQHTLEQRFTQAQRAMENELASVTLEQIVTDLLVQDSSIPSTMTTINKG
ncbi:Rrf2 family transcriptional regulator [Paenibacillus macquariensis]|uniref:Transcriptional regulator, BadM/Rrf2 family n=1 Tax=Paenibacillus macquariensis TaxID=948756 RepID=A0ABY1KCL6_9BACL|nr:Rrf2 family transcriptional regulator [Paenibacillus macquariensis]MEC0094160.1 Rrf2 family transcriptional regulator [Paenibacillus macquariensis]OAB26182.1 Rrf2 family transcriptional regulator [Paenibacillus macquariensis subsp. macquariensis]SIR60830.1 transcriptional regulator, BadM/Rrf2 family [Paenibacillus macquariensis]